MISLEGRLAPESSSQPSPASPEGAFVGKATAHLKVDMPTFHKYAGLSLPRHVSYPMPSWWRPITGEETEAMIRASLAAEPVLPLSLYLHIPFCEALCKYCACNKVILRKEAKGAAEKVSGYLAALESEIRRVGALAGRGRSLRQIHWGGGSPTYLEPAAVSRLTGLIRETFDISPDVEMAMEIDPRHATRPFLENLRECGFNRLSMGVQDVDEQVQRHVHRLQPVELVREVVSHSRALGFPSVNFDLIYGLPYQTLATVREAIERTIELSPDRVAFYHYAQIPDKIATQRGIHHQHMPDSDVKLEMFLMAVQLFESAGYDFIGLDHFAKPDEALAEAVRDGSIQRNFQGMTTGGGLDLIGVGVSAISHLSQIGFYQNDRDIDQYVASVEAGQSPVHVGKPLTFDDRVRQAVINQLYCSAIVDPAQIESSYGIRFDEYFRREQSVLQELVADGLVTLSGDHKIALTFPLGRVLMRNVAAVFDAYLDPDAWKCGARNQFSVNA